ncbi:hypothetical protein BC567DRAFT_208844 [Phyllosticta citribraziliensis]
MHFPNAPLALILLITLSLTLLTLPTPTTARAVRHHSYRHGHVALSSQPYARSAQKTHNAHNNAHNNAHSLPHHHQHHHQHHQKPSPTHGAAAAKEKALKNPTRFHVAAVRVPTPRPRTRMSSFRRVWEWGRGRVVGGGGNVTAESTAAAGNVGANSGIGHGKRDGPKMKAVMGISRDEFMRECVHNRKGLFTIAQ